MVGGVEPRPASLGPPLTPLAPPLFVYVSGLFGWPITSHEMLSEVEAEIAPYAQLWSVAVELKTELPVWYDGPFMNVDPHEVVKKSKDWMRTLNTTLEKFEELEDDEAQEACAETIDKLGELEDHLPVITTLRAPGMRERHWEMLNQRCAQAAHTVSTSAH